MEWIIIERWLLFSLLFLSCSSTEQRESVFFFQGHRALNCSYRWVIINACPLICATGAKRRFVESTIDARCHMDIRWLCIRCQMCIRTGSVCHRSASVICRHSLCTHLLRLTNRSKISVPNTKWVNTQVVFRYARPNWINSDHNDTCQTDWLHPIGSHWLPLGHFGSVAEFIGALPIFEQHGWLGIRLVFEIHRWRLQRCPHQNAVHEAVCIGILVTRIDFGEYDYQCAVCSVQYGIYLPRILKNSVYFLSPNSGYQNADNAMARDERIGHQSIATSRCGRIQHFVHRWCVQWVSN